MEFKYKFKLQSVERRITLPTLQLFLLFFVNLILVLRLYSQRGNNSNKIILRSLQAECYCSISW